MVFYNDIFYVLVTQSSMSVYCRRYMLSSVGGDIFIHIQKVVLSLYYISSLSVTF